MSDLLSIFEALSKNNNFDKRVFCDLFKGKFLFQEVFINQNSRKIKEVYMNNNFISDAIQTFDCH